MPSDPLFVPDDLDAWLDGRPADVPPWLPALDTRLRVLDDAFDPTGIQRSSQLARSTHEGTDRAIPWDYPTADSRARRVAATAAIIALLLAGPALAARLFVRPDHGVPSVLVAPPAGSTPAESAIVNAFTAPPTACDLPSLTRADLDALLVGATPLTDDAYVRYLIASGQAIASELQPILVDDEIVFTGGSRVDTATAESLQAALGSYLACINAGDPRVVGFDSARLLRLVPHRPQLYAAVEPGATIEGPTAAIDELEVAQLRRIADGRIVASLTFRSAGTGGSPAVALPSPTVVGATGLGGIVFVFVQTGSGWRIDGTFFPSDVVRLPPPTAPVSAKPASG